ncbi:MAG: hypothetical protein GY950_20805 [bacterium]|nr:hypothetical protein [bacterium]
MPEKAIVTAKRPVVKEEKAFVRPEKAIVRPKFAIVTPKIAFVRVKTAFAAQESELQSMVLTMGRVQQHAASGGPHAGAPYKGLG